MSEFGRELVRVMDERGVGVRQLARDCYVNPGHVSNIRSGKDRPSAELADAIDNRLGAGGRLAALAAAARPRPRGGGRPRTGRAVEALKVTMAGSGDDGDLDVAGDGLAELADHYAQVIAVAPSSAAYEELRAARSFAGTLLGRGSATGRGDLAVSAGWLSSLLAVAATDLGDHAAAVVWCADAARRGRDAGHPELGGWAALTRALIAWYQGDPARSAAAARAGQAETATGTAAYAKLAAQEMRCAAMLGDHAAMIGARRRAAAAIGSLGPAAAASGVYFVRRGDDPPYTATSLLVAGRHAEAAAMTRKVIASYAAANRPPGDMPTEYARTLLILALATAGLGDADEAASAGAAALSSGRIVWPTMVLASRLEQSLTARAAGSGHAADFRARLADAGTRLALPAGGEGSPGE